jgi:hypothetical protein
MLKKILYAVFPSVHAEALRSEARRLSGRGGGLIRKGQSGSVDSRLSSLKVGVDDTLKACELRDRARRIERGL